MGTNSNKGVSISDEQLGLRALGWMFVKTVVFCAVLCVVVLGMAEFVTR